MRSTVASRGRRLVFALVLGFVSTTQSGCDLLALVDLLNSLATPGLSSRVALREPTLPFQGEAPATGSLTLATAFPNLTFLNPTFLGFVPGTNKLFVLEQAGLVVKTRSAQWRPCSLDAAPLAEADAWLAPYRSFFERRLARLDRQLRREKE